MDVAIASFAKLTPLIKWLIIDISKSIIDLPVAFLATIKLNLSRYKLSISQLPNSEIGLYENFYNNIFFIFCKNIIFFKSKTLPQYFNDFK